MTVVDGILQINNSVTFWSEVLKSSTITMYDDLGVIGLRASGERVDEK